ncbi:MAG: hypothetical protein RR356_06190 [Bacteroidales bacterium]
MRKIAIIIFADTTTVEDLGRVANAFVLADEAIEAKDQLQIIFEGTGTKWIGELENSEHKLHHPYTQLKSHISVCKFCAEAFGVKHHAVKAGLALRDEYKDHLSVRTLLVEGYDVITY